MLFLAFIHPCMNDNRSFLSYPFVIIIIVKNDNGGEKIISDESGIV
jgi:hypothetical protein